MVERIMTTGSSALSNRSVLSLMDWTPQDVQQVINTAQWLKANPHDVSASQALSGKQIALLFELPSTRTRVSFQVAVNSLGAHPIVLNWQETQLGRGEPIEDTARVLSRYVDGIVVRCRDHAVVQALRQWAQVPIYNALTNFIHPFQALADALTVKEHVGGLSGVHFAYIGDGNNMAHSYLVLGAKLGWHVKIASPPNLMPSADVVAWAQAEAEITGGSVTITHDPMIAAADADVVATDVFISMGDAGDIDEKRAMMARYQVNAALMDQAKDSAIFLHCLPAHRGEEVTAEVIDGPQSVVFDEAENRVWAQKSVLFHTLS
ncbi:MAG: ornithine carbamoyltransferase [Firmicutes bacterium]|nr:ornithine carbamoyltransferase [Bacillota bacterium]